MVFLDLGVWRTRTTDYHFFQLVLQASHGGQQDHDVALMDTLSSHRSTLLFLSIRLFTAKAFVTTVTSPASLRQRTSTATSLRLSVFPMVLCQGFPDVARKVR
jgi:hypothetical protein